MTRGSEDIWRPGLCGDSLPWEFLTVDESALLGYPVSCPEALFFCPAPPTRLYTALNPPPPTGLSKIYLPLQQHLQNGAPERRRLALQFLWPRFLALFNRLLSRRITRIVWFRAPGSTYEKIQREVLPAVSGWGFTHWENGCSGSSRDAAQPVAPANAPCYWILPRRNRPQTRGGPLEQLG